MAEQEKSRVQILKELVAAAEQGPRTTLDVPFQGKPRPFTRIQIRTDFPLYRLESGRTRRAQVAYLETHDLPKTFFEDPEDPKAQKAQHEILLRMIGEKDLSQDLKEHEQKTPIILACDGTIVDGNRRIAALRHAKVEYVTAVVLPERATPSEIYETELELQMARDTKASYNWIDELLHVRFGIDKLGEPLGTIARRMRLTESELKEGLERLAMTELYLAWLGCPGKFNRIPIDADQAFVDLVQGARSKAIRKLSPIGQVAVREMCFASIQAKGGYEVVRDIVKLVPSRAQDVLERLSAESESASTVSKALANKKDTKKRGGPRPDPLSRLAESEAKDTHPSFQSLSTIFSQPDVAQKITHVLVQVVDELAEEERDIKRQSNSLQLVEKARLALEKIQLDPKRDDLGKVTKALAKVVDEVNRISKRSEMLRKGARE